MNKQFDNDEENGNFDILMGNQKLSQMIDGGKSNKHQVQEKTENLKMILKSESSDNKIMM